MSHQPIFDALCAEQLIEPAASGNTVSDPRNPPNEMFQASIAISLKRIADVLEGANMDAFQNQLLDIAYKAGLNFRGQA